MVSLQQLTQEAGPVLLLDASSAMVQVGCGESVEQLRWASSPEEAGQALFQAIDELAVDLRAVRSLVFCEGPGSILGIRTSAMAVRVWRQLTNASVYTYRSLDLLAHAHPTPGLTLIADARKQSWHALTLRADGKAGPIRRLRPEELTEPLATPDGFRQWSPLPVLPVARLSYNLAELWSRCARAELLRPADAPDAFHHEEPNYATWTPQVHQSR